MLRMLVVVLSAVLWGGCVTSSKAKKISYVDWEPAIQTEDVFRSAIGFTYVSTDDVGRAYWVEPRPHEGGRAVLVQVGSDGQLRDITPQEFSVRSRIFEYGSTPYAVKGEYVYFSNFSDQRVYRQNINGVEKPVALTVAANADGGVGKYAEYAVSPDGRWLVFSYEVEFKKGEAKNYVGLLDLKKDGSQEAVVLASGADFYKIPQFSPDGKQLAWLEWNHPYMFWDSTYLYIAPFKDGKLGKKTKIAGSDTSSIWRFTFTDNGKLYYGRDFAGEKETSPKNFFNIYVYQNGKSEAVTLDHFDYFGLKAAGNQLMAMEIVKGEARAVVFDPATKKRATLAADYVDFGLAAFSRNGRFYMPAMSSDRPTELIEAFTDGRVNVLRKAADVSLDPLNVSKAGLIEYPTADGQTAYGYFYPPVNSRYSAPEGEKPPVRVLIHGGPTAMTSKGFSLANQFWTSQGYAIFDVNYRGSFGFGRRYRDALRMKWGILEIQDVRDGLEYLRKQGKIGSAAVVSGGSAGGYTVQRLLTYYPDLFATGASHFGIGNLVTLQKLTHKYESHYLEQLIGGTLETNLAEYNARSPINHLDQLKAPMIIFQGSDDKVVPPENSREMAAILKKKGITHEYYEYPGEGHGFRKKENMIDSQNKESAFFKRVLRKRGG